jgi:hypothetical protein
LGGIPAVVVILGGLYLATLLRDVGYGTDTAKFQYLGRVLGTAHQPGYPLFTALLAVTVRVIPVGEDAVRVGLLSAAFGVAACVVVFLLLHRLGVHRLVALGGALLVGVTRTLWSQAVVIEVYTLHALFTVGVLYLLLQWQASRRDRDLVLGLAVLALSFSHHTASVLLLPGVALFIALVDWRAPFRWAVLRFVPLFGLLVVGPYAYIAWRTFDPSTPYLEVQIRGVTDLVASLRGTNYKDLMFVFGPRQLASDRVPMLGGLLRDEPLLWAVPLAAVGVLRLRLRPVNVLLVAWCAAVTLWGLEYDISDVFVYFLLTYMFVVMWTAVGVDWLVNGLPKRTRVGAAALTLLAPLAVVLANYDAVDLSDDTIGGNVRTALAAMPDGGVVFTSHYHHFNYVLLGQGRQDELRVYAQYPQPLERIARYCRGEQIGLGHVQGDAPVGLPVYAYGPGVVAGLRAEGFVLQPVIGDLARLDCAVIPPTYIPPRNVP